MDIGVEAHTKLKGTVTAMQNDRLPWWNLWRELANYYLPSRYTWLLSDNERRVERAAQISEPSDDDDDKCRYHYADAHVRINAHDGCRDDACESRERGSQTKNETETIRTHAHIRCVQQNDNNEQRA